MSRLRLKDATLLVMDVQEKFVPVLFEAERAISACNFLIRGCKLLGIPILVTEQYPQGLGHTVKELIEALGDSYQPIAKLDFSAFAVDEFRSLFTSMGRSQLLICGIEAHVCIWQTVQDALGLGYEVFVAEDATTSRYPLLWHSGIERCVEVGAVRTNTEMALLEIIGTANHPKFRSLQALLKEWMNRIHAHR